MEVTNSIVFNLVQLDRLGSYTCVDAGRNCEAGWKIIFSEAFVSNDAQTHEHQSQLAGRPIGFVEQFASRFQEVTGCIKTFFFGCRSRG